jgi:hypothetical protein
MDQPLSPSPQQFAGMGVTLTVWPDHLELYRTSWWRWPPWQPARTTLRRGDLVEYRVLPWGPAVLLVSCGTGTPARWRSARRPQQRAPRSRPWRQNHAGRAATAGWAG